MVRRHYSARVGGDRREARTYSGVPTASQTQIRTVVSAAPGLSRCLVCDGHARLVGAPYSDEEQSVVYGVTRVLASHSPGGKLGGGKGKCPGSHSLKFVAV